MGVMKMHFKSLVGLFLILLIALYPLQHQGDSHVLASKSESHPFKAITYNIHSGKNLAGERSIDDIVRLLAKEAPDFIALQEVDRRKLATGMEDQISTLANQLGMEYVFTPALRNGFSQYGNGILSRYPILAQGKLDLIGGKEARVLLWAKVYTEQGSLYLTSVHLDTERASRSAHFTKIREFIDSKLSDAPVLLMGDLNTLYDHPDLMALEYSITGKYQDYEIPTFYHQKAGRSIQIDYIMGRGIIEDRTYTLTTDASDHIPLVLIFDIGTIPYKDSYPNSLDLHSTSIS